ncbi:hypothetical protein [Sphingobium sp. EP60837]|uniref:hypothetical protein n=1 Tax=Sphingobium sp. EP60837 TaxID=1855519 RepID=UPI0007DD2A9D|nr:hypothetical protein [Sphingobium sp. EP60837]ANI79005.1 hypothetical protein EP837_02610 [Sphingobium sp. EP60837]
MAMMFRGLGKPTDQLDIQIAPQGGGFGPTDPGMSMPSQMPMPQTVPEKRPGASFAGIAADFLAGMAGQQGPYAAQVQHQRALQERERLAQRQRMAERDDYVWKLQQKQQFPDPVAPHYWETNDGSLGMIGPDGKPTIAYKDPTPKINWIRADNGDGTQSLIPVGPNGPIDAKGGDPAISPTPGPTGNSGPASAGPGVPHLTVDQMRSIGQGVNFSQWQQREGTPVLVTSAEEMARVPVGTLVISPDGRRGVKK